MSYGNFAKVLSVAAIALGLGFIGASSSSANTITGTPLTTVDTWIDGGPKSTNADNYAIHTDPTNQRRPFVLLYEDSTPGQIKLEFHNNAPGVAYFEYRLDGVATGVLPHQIVVNDTEHAGVFLAANAVAPVLETFMATSTVDVRLALGGESDYRFDWTRFDVTPVPLPAAAWAGFALMGGMGLVRRFRDRQQVA